MVRKALMDTMRRFSPWRVLILLILVYVAIRLVIPWLVEVGVPFWARAIFLAMGPLVGIWAGPWLSVRRR